MRIGRFADNDGSPFWGLIDPGGETVRRIDGDITEWAAAAATEDVSGFRLHEPEPTGGLRALAPVDPGARVFGVGANYLAHPQKLGVTQPPANPTAFPQPHTPLTVPHRP